MQYRFLVGVTALGASFFTASISLPIVAQNAGQNAPVYLQDLRPGPGSTVMDAEETPEVVSVDVANQRIKVKSGGTVNDFTLSPAITYMKAEGNLGNTDLRVGDTIELPSWVTGGAIALGANKATRVGYPSSFYSSPLTVISVSPLKLRIGDEVKEQDAETVIEAPFTPGMNTDTPIGTMKVVRPRKSSQSAQKNGFSVIVSVVRPVVGFIRSTPITLQDLATALAAKQQVDVTILKDKNGRTSVNALTLRADKPEPQK